MLAWNLTSPTQDEINDFNTQSLECFTVPSTSLDMYNSYNMHAGKIVYLK